MLGRRSHWLVAALAFTLLLPLPVYPQQPFVTCGNDPLSCTFDDLLEVPVRIFNFMLGMAAFVLLGVIVWAGIRWMTYYMGEKPEADLKDAKWTLTRGITGFAIVVGAILIVNTLLALLGAGSGAVWTGLRGFGIGF